MTTFVPLPSLLTAVLGHLEQGYIDAGADGRRFPSLDLWSNLLRSLDDNGIDLRQLPEILRLSRRAVRTRVATAVRRGWIEEHKTIRSRVTVRLTLRGSAISFRWKSLAAAAEDRFQAQCGLKLANQLRAALETLVVLLPLEHPHYPASYGPADASITGGNGNDWKAIPRADSATVSGLALSALVSQVLVAFAMDYEEESPVALSLCTGVIDRIPAEGRPLRELENSVGVSALIRHGFVHATGGNAQRIAYLTPKGLAVSRACQKWIRDVETAWRNRFGCERITTLRRVLEDVASAQCHAGRSKENGSP